MPRVVFAAVCFVLSGACGLIYENVWIKQVGTIFGSTVLATTVVLGAFMGGLALGAAWIGRYADRLERPLRIYAWLELGITLGAALFPAGLAAVRAGYRDLLVPAGLSRSSLLTYELFAVSVLLVVPTALMGATLPVLMRFASGWMRRTGAALGLLYAVNTAGAVAGSLAAGFWLIPALGLDGTSRVAQVLNLFVGLAALAFAAALGDELEDEEDADNCYLDPPPTPYGSPSTAPPPARLVHVHVFLCGFAAMLYEIALMKLLPLILGSSTYSFSLMLAAFISGIALGSAVIGAWIGSARRPVAVLGGLLILQGLAFMASIPFYNQLPELYLQMRAGSRLPFAVYQVASFGICFLVMVVPTFFLGGVLPVAAQLVTRARTVADDIGRLYAANTVGNILGTVITGLVLVPHLGFKMTMEVGLSLNLLSGLRLLWCETGLAVRRRTLATAVVAVAVLSYARGYPGMDIARLNAGVFRLGRQGELARQQLENDLAKTTVTYAREDETCFVTVTHNGENFSLRVNGKPDASSAGDMQTQKMLAHWPLLLRPDARRALVIGLGSGITAGAALRHPLKALECAELSPAVVEAARYFVDFNYSVHDDERFALVVDDGRNYLERSVSRYDVIISEPSNPWIAGIGSLFTVECFNTAAAHLTPGGVMAQWMHTYEMDPETFRIVLRTFRAVFPHVTLMQCQKYDVVMLGSMAPLDLDVEALEQRLHAPRVHEDLKSIGLANALALAAHHYIPEEQVAAEAGTGPLNTDDHPRLEYLAPVGFYMGSTATLPATAYVDNPQHMLRRAVMRHPPAPAQVVELVQLLAKVYPPGQLADILEESMARRTPDAGLYLVLSRLRRGSGEVRASLDAAKRAGDLLPRNPHVQQSLHDAALGVENLDVSVEHPWRAPISEGAARSWQQLAPEDPAAAGALGMVLYREQRWAEAEAALSTAVRLATSHPDRPQPDAGTWLFQATLARLERRDTSGAVEAWTALQKLDRSRVSPELRDLLEYRIARALAPAVTAPSPTPGAR